MRSVWCGNRASNRFEPLVGAVRSCTVASESFDLFNRSAAALAKSQDRRASLGVFAFWPRPSGRDSKWACMGCTQETPATVTPAAEPTSVD